MKEAGPLHHCIIHWLQASPEERSWHRGKWLLLAKAIPGKGFIYKLSTINTPMSWGQLAGDESDRGGRQHYLLEWKTLNVSEPWPFKRIFNINILLELIQ